MVKSQNKILIMGIGNLLLGDEGVGVHFINYMKKKEIPKNVTLLDGGTGGFYLLSVINEYKKMIIIDATIDNFSPGHIRLLKPKISKDFPKTLTTHDIGLKDLIESAILLDKLPEIYLVVITINQNQTVGLHLSEEIKKSLAKIETKVYKAINKLSENYSKVDYS